MDDFGEENENPESDDEKAGRKKKCACFDPSFAHGL
jgi:hypothetical protein